MTETKKKKLLIGLVAAVLIVVFFFAGFGAGYSTGKGADSAPDADAVPGGGLYVENSSSDGLKVATLSATRTASSSDPYGFDYFNSPFRSEDSDRYVTWFSAGDSRYGSRADFPFDSYAFLEVAYSDGTPIESSADIEWTLTCEDAYWDVAGKNWKEYFRSFLTLLGDQPVENGFFDLAVYEDESHARVGCKCPFFFPVTLSVKVTTREKKVYTADLSIGYRKSRAERSARELYFGDGIGSISTWGYSGGHDDALGIDYVALRIPIYSYGVMTESHSYADDLSFYFGDSNEHILTGTDVLGAYLKKFGYGDLYDYPYHGYNVSVLGGGNYRYGSGLRYIVMGLILAGIVSDDQLPSEYDPRDDYFGVMDMNDFSWTGRTFDDVHMWTDDPDYTPADAESVYLYPSQGDVEVMLGPGFRNGGIYAGIGDPYDGLAELFEKYEFYDSADYFTYTGPDDVTTFIDLQGLKTTFNEFYDAYCDEYSWDDPLLESHDMQQPTDWSLTDFCMWPGAIYGSDDFDTALACIKEGARKYLADPASYKWEPTYYIRCPDGGWLGVGLDFSGGPNGYRGISA